MGIYIRGYVRGLGLPAAHRAEQSRIPSGIPGLLDTPYPPEQEVPGLNALVLFGRGSNVNLSFIYGLSLLGASGELPARVPLGT